MSEQQRKQVNWDIPKVSWFAPELFDEIIKSLQHSYVVQRQKDRGNDNRCENQLAWQQRNQRKQIETASPASEEQSSEDFEQPEPNNHQSRCRILFSFY